MTYDNLLIEAENNGITVKEKPLIGNNGRIHNSKIAIKSNIPTLKMKACILAEELGHYHTTHGNITDQSKIENRKQEQQARLWA